MHSSQTAVRRCVGCLNTSQVSAGLKGGSRPDWRHERPIPPQPRLLPLTSTHLSCATFGAGDSGDQGVDPCNEDFILLSLLTLPGAAYFVLGEISMISALLLSFCLNFLLLAFPLLFPETQKQFLSCAFICVATGKKRQE